MATCVIERKAFEQALGKLPGMAGTPPGRLLDELRSSVLVLFQARQLLLDCDRAAALHAVGSIGHGGVGPDASAVKRLQRQAELARQEVRSQSQRCIELCAAIGSEPRRAELASIEDTLSRLGDGWALPPLPLTRPSRADRVRAA